MENIIKQLLITEIIDEINEPKYNEFIKKRCEFHLQNISFNKQLTPRHNKGYISEELFTNKINRCHANVYNNGYIRQCSNSSKCNDLCGLHINIKKNKGFLIFGDINNDYRKHIKYNCLNCNAVTFNNGLIDQCSNVKHINNLCCRHDKYLINNKRLKYGLINK